MTVNDLIKRCNSEDLDKVIVFNDGEGWTNVDVAIKGGTIELSASSNSPFSDGG